MPERILVYVVNGNGFGHLVRTLAVTTRLRALMPDARFLVLTSCEGPSPVAQEEFAFIKMPSWQSGQIAALTRDERADLVRRATAAVFAAFAPTVLLTDVVACGMYGELAQHLGTTPRKFIFLRPCRALRAGVPQFMRCLMRYDRIMVPYAPGTDVDLPQDIARAAHWVGPITLQPRAALLSRSEARQRLGLPPTGRILLVTMGGGGSSQAERMLRLVLQMVPLRPDVLFAVARPPLATTFPPPDRADNVRVFSYVPLVECLNAFDGAISSCGVNGSAELVMAGVPMVWLPLDHATQDQAENARRYAAQGIGVLPNGLSPATLLTAISKVLNPVEGKIMRRRMSKASLRNGADVAAALIHDWCQAPAAAPHAAG